MTMPPAAPVPNDPPHKPADDHEVVYYDGRPSSISAIGHFMLFTFAALVVGALPFVIGRNHQIPGWTYAVGIVIALVLFAVPFVQVKSRRYRITNYRIDFERGLLWKRIDTLELWHVEDLTLTQGPLDRMLGLGHITIVSHDTTTPRLMIYGLPHARPTFDQLKQRIIAVKRQRGVIKMDVG